MDEYKSNVKSDQITGIDNIAHESLINGYLRQLNEYDFITPYSIINLSFMYYFDQISWDQIDLFIKQKVAFITDLLDVSDDKALELLLKNKWNTALVSDYYFNDMGTQTQMSNVAKQQQNQPNFAVQCLFCTESNDDIFSLECGHKVMCKNHWIYYLQTNAVSEECLSLTCPKKECHVVVPPDTWKQLLCKQYKLDYQRYIRFLREHCIKFNKESFTNCGNKECKMIYFSLYDVSDNVGVKCKKCEQEFCWGCNDVGHFPLTCDDAKQWLIKCQLRAASVSSIQDNGDKCPKCDNTSPRHNGSNLKKCSKCKHLYCWLCRNANKANYKYHRCYYTANVRDTMLFADRFEYVYHRFNANLLSAKYALKNQRENWVPRVVRYLRIKEGWRAHEMMFLCDAVDALIECWHVLAWASVTLFYIGDSQEYDLYMVQLAQLQQFCNALHDEITIPVENFAITKHRNEIILSTRCLNKCVKALADYINTELSLEFVNKPDEKDVISPEIIQKQNKKWFQRAVKELEIVVAKEPKKNDPNAIELRIRMPNSKVVQRRFNKGSTIEQLYIWCRQHLGVVDKKISLSQAMPRRSLDDKKDRTFQALNLSRTTVICSLQQRI